MDKTINKTNKRKIIIIVGVLLVISIVAGLFISNGLSTSKEASDRNIGLYQKAAQTSDLTLCDQIKGGINATDNNNSNKNKEHAFEVALSVEYKNMNERQAQESCRMNVQRINDLKESDD